jgi:hypothetical protein
MTEFLLTVVLLPIALPILFNALMFTLGVIGVIGVTVAEKHKRKKAEEDERIAWTYVDEFDIKPEDIGLDPNRRPK